MFFELPAIVVLVSSLWGLVSLWVATSNAAFHVRSLVIVLLLTLFLFIPAYEPILYLAVQCLVVAVCMAVAKAFMNDTKPTVEQARFSLRSLLIATVLLAGLLTMAARAPNRAPIFWAHLLLAGVASGLATLFAANVALAANRRWLRVLTAVIATPVIAIPVAMTDGTPSVFLRIAGNPGQYFPQWVGVFYAIQLLVAIWLFLWRQVYRSKDGYHLAEHRTSRSVCRGAISVMTLVLVLPCVYVYLLLVFVYVAPQNPLNKIKGPNGYDDLVQASLLYVWHPAIANLTEKTSAVEIEQGLERNKAALALLQKGVRRPCEQHIALYREPAVVSASVARMSNLAQLMQAQGELALRQGRTADATRIYLDLVRFGHGLEYGGCLFDAALSGEIQSIGQHDLIKLRGEISRRERDVIVVELSELDRNRESWSSCYDRDYYRGVLEYGWLSRLSRLPGADRGFLTGLIDRRNEVIARTRLLIVECAIKNHLEEHGTLPTSLDVLRVDHDILADPFSSTPAQLHYRRDDGGFTLYSVGPDGDDDAGAFDPNATTQDGDFLLPQAVGGK